MLLVLFLVALGSKVENRASCAGLHPCPVNGHERLHSGPEGKKEFGVKDFLMGEELLDAVTFCRSLEAGGTVFGDYGEAAALGEGAEVLFPNVDEWANDSEVAFPVGGKGGREV